ncbi:MAG TPA: PxKF domain-containing protein, partial [Mycobacteriales bacterium]|nr:PxKF domain-containing protein [Mycobacteriales bacterium]
TTGLAVGNADPAVRIMSPVEGFEVRVGTSFDLTTQVSDPGVNDDVTCTIDWGDGTADTTGCKGSHSYAVADAYNIEVTARDSDGGVDHTSITVHVKAPAWQFEGFFAPVDNAPIVNVVKAGSTVPVKFGLGGNRGMDIFAPGFPASSKVACREDGGVPLQVARIRSDAALPGPSPGSAAVRGSALRTRRGACLLSAAGRMPPPAPGGRRAHRCPIASPSCPHRGGRRPAATCSSTRP